MSNDEEFEIPFEFSRKGRESEQETKAVGRRLASYVTDRLIDRPRLHGGRRHRRHHDIDIPTAGVPGSRRPTGSDFDPDGDGWVDEGTTRPRFIGTNKPSEATSTVRKLSSGQSATLDAPSSEDDHVEISRKRLDGLRAAVAELERSGNWTGKDNNVILSANSRSNEPLSTLDIDKPGINPTNQTREEHIALINAELDSRNINDPAQREQEIKKAISERVKEAKEKLALAEESMRIQEFEAARKKIRNEQNVLDVEQIPAEKISVLKSEADSIRSLSKQQIDNIFISPTPANAYFIHHGVAELDEGIFIPERSKGGGRGSGQMLGNTRALNETQTANLRRDFVSRSAKAKAFRSLLQKLRANDDSSIVQTQEEISAIAQIISSPYTAFASDNKLTRGWEIGDSLRISDMNQRKGNAFLLDGIIKEVELNLGVEETRASEMQSVLAALGEDSNFMSTHSGLYEAATNYSGYLDRYPTSAFSEMIKDIHTYWLKDLATSNHRRGTSWFGVGRWGHDVTLILGPGDEWQVLGKNKPIAGISKPQGFSSTEYDDILLALTPRIVKMHDEKGYVDINELLGDINEPIDYSKRLSSGSEKPSFPRKPTYGAFIGGAEEEFGDAKTWEEFNDKYKNREIVFFDYETTGLVFDEFRKPSSNGNPTQFGAVKMKDGKIIDSINIFMDPEEPLGEWSRANLKDIDGNPLTDDWLKTQTSIKKAHERLADFAGDNAIFGVQNASFDKDVLELALSQSGITWRPKGYLDTKEIADMALPRWTPETDDGPFILDANGNKKPSNGLAAITKYLGVDLGEKHHTADADAEATGLVMSAIIDGAIKNNWSTDVLDREKRSQKLQANNAKFADAVEKFEQDVAEFRRLSSGIDDDYRGMHQAPDAETGAPLHNLAGVYPDDVYSANSIRYYGTGNDELDAIAASIIKKFRGKPDAEVTVYRAVPISRDAQIERLEKQKAYILRTGKLPRGIDTTLTSSEYYDKISNELDVLRNQDESELVSINKGDWVTPIRSYAVEHGEGPLRGDYEIVKKRVKASDVYTNGDSWYEWGYDPDGGKTLSSGREYESVVERENFISDTQSEAVDDLSMLIKNAEFKQEDEYVENTDPRFDEMQKLRGVEYDIFAEDVLADSPERDAIKKSVTDAVSRSFSSQIKTRKDVVVKANNGDEINLGNEFDVIATPTAINVGIPEDSEMEQLASMLDDESFQQSNNPITRVTIHFTVETKDKNAARKLKESGIPVTKRWESLGDIEDFEPGTTDGQLSIASAYRTLIFKDGNAAVMHDSIGVGRAARGNGVASLLNARNEAVYRQLGIKTIITQAQSSVEGDYNGVTHWARNGFTWANEDSKNELLNIIQNALDNTQQNFFTDEERKRISSLITKKRNGQLSTSATAEELVDFENADNVFRKNDSIIYLKRNLSGQRQDSAPRSVVNRLLRRNRSNTRTTQTLASGRERPTITLRKPDVKRHQARAYKYGDKSELGGEVRRTKQNWLKDMTPRQMSEVLVPKSMDEYMDMLIDDYAPGGRDYPDYVKKFKAVHDNYFANNPWDEIDFSPEAVEAVRDTVEKALEANPKLRWAFETHGAPMFYMNTNAATAAYDKSPGVAEKLERIRQIRGMDPNNPPYVRARTNPFLSSVALSRRLIIDRASNTPTQEKEDLLMDPFRRVTSRDSAIDKSVAGVLTHEWGHWLHFRALRDRELAGQKRNRHYYGSGDPQDKRYARALEIADEYNFVIMDELMMKRFDEKVDMESVKDAPMTLSSYGNTNKAEAFAEGIVAVLHPNDDIKNHALNTKLRNDVYAVLFPTDDTEPWKSMMPAKTERPGRLSSGSVTEKKVVRYSPDQIQGIAKQITVKYAESPEKRQMARKTLQKGFQGGFTVELDTMKDVTSGLAVARNRKGMIFPAAKDFTPEGDPTEELVDTFVAWLNFHGPEVFSNPSPGAERVAIGGWVDNGTLYLDVTDIYPTGDFLPKAQELGGKESQKAVTNLDKLYELLQAGAEDLSPAFIDTGGDGGETITRETINQFRQMLLDFEKGEPGQPKLPIKKINKNV